MAKRFPDLSPTYSWPICHSMTSPD